MSELDKEIIEEMLAHLSKSLKINDEQKFAEEINEAFGHFSKLPSPEVFSMYKNSRDTVIGALLTREYGDDPWQIVSIYSNYRFVSANLSRLLTRFEGMACSSDKERRIVAAYIKSILTDKPASELFWYDWADPQEGSGELWLSMTDSLVRLAAGQNDPYLKTLLELTKFYADLDKSNANVSE